MDDLTAKNDAATPPPPGPRSANRGIRIALAVSVALNLAVAGLVAGIVLTGGPGRHGEFMVRDMGFGPFDSALRPQDREALRSAIRERLGDIGAARERMQEDVSGVLAALKAEPFDPAALTAAMGRQSDHLGERLKFGSTLIRDYLLTLSDADRRDLAERLEDRLRRGRGGSDSPGDGLEGKE